MSWPIKCINLNDQGQNWKITITSFKQNENYQISCNESNYTANLMWYIIGKIYYLQVIVTFVYLFLSIQVQYNFVLNNPITVIRHEIERRALHLSKTVKIIKFRLVNQKIYPILNHIWLENLLFLI